MLTVQSGKVSKTGCEKGGKDGCKKVVKFSAVVNVIHSV